MRLIVVDSVAVLVRKEFGVGGGGDAAARTSDALSTEASRMKRLAEAYGLAVVATNHVTTTSARGGEERVVTAALGNTWHHATNLRIVLEYATGPAGMIGQGPSHRTIMTAGETGVEGGAPALRMLRIAKSPASAARSFPYVIDSTGLVLANSIY